MSKQQGLSGIWNYCAIALIIRYFLIRKRLAGYWRRFKREQAVKCEQVLQELGYKQSRIIGQVMPASSGVPPLRFV
ncbi:hypothetical protein [Coleofasciculus sp. F4-SAH-05]|uniref:hypothetical protein n=1 Tax=Coleofasciculus sp. F4-SAH-05 TaxID=3069525 RepID=UPI0033011294